MNTEDLWAMYNAPIELHNAFLGGRIKGLAGTCASGALMLSVTVRPTDQFFTIDTLDRADGRDGQLTGRTYYFTINQEYHVLKHHHTREWRHVEVL